MEAQTQVSPQAFVEAMKQQTEEFLQAVMASVNQAPDGAWIADSEERVRDLNAEFRRQAFEQAVQMRVDAAEAAFPPSAPSPDGKASEQQGPTG